MEARELRIGNWVEVQGSRQGYLLGWTSKNMVDIKLKHSTLNDHVEHLSPILLNEGWLENFGFEYDGETWFTNKQETIAVDLSDDMVCINGAWLNNSVYYVHQLQNLYFALTGEELEVKEKAPQE